MAGVTQIALYLLDDPSQVIYPRFFPEEVEFHWEQKWAEDTIPGLELPIYQWVSGGSRPIRLALLFDAEPRPWKATHPAKALEWFRRNVPPMETTGDLGTRRLRKNVRPVYRIAFFDGKVAIDVVIKSVSTKATRFDRSQAPSRLETEIEAEWFEPMILKNDWRRTGVALHSVPLALDPATGNQGILIDTFLPSEAGGSGQLYGPQSELVVPEVLRP